MNDLYDVIRFERSNGVVEVLMCGCKRDEADSLGDCISEHPGYSWAVVPAHTYNNGDVYPVAPAMQEDAQ